MTAVMECGHAANGVRVREDGTRTPCCVICAGISGGASDREATVQPDLSSRTARCGYYRSTPGGRSNEAPCRRGACLCERPSDPGLAFFAHTPDRDYDRFYCGCWGWD